MLNNWQVGDVIRMQSREARAAHIAMVVTEPRRHVPPVNGGYTPLSDTTRVWGWCLTPGGAWHGPFHGPAEKYELHPDPDPVLASFAAWRLAGGGDNG